MQLHCCYSRGGHLQYIPLVLLYVTPHRCPAAMPHVVSRISLKLLFVLCESLLVLPIMLLVFTSVMRPIALAYLQ